MAVGDKYIFASGLITDRMPLTGVVQEEGAEIKLAWDNATVVSYRDFSGAEQIDDASIGDVNAWIAKTVQRQVGNVGNRLRGTVVRVYVRDPAGTPELALIVRLENGLFGRFNAADVDVVENT